MARGNIVTPELPIRRIFCETDFSQQILGDLKLFQGGTGPPADAHPVFPSFGIYASIPGLTPIRTIEGKASEGKRLPPVLACPSFDE